jgi:hypothetical protein
MLGEHPDLTWLKLVRTFGAADACEGVLYVLGDRVFGGQQAGFGADPDRAVAAGCAY